MKFIHKIIERQYSDIDEDQKRSISILLILDFLLISIMAVWCVIFWFIEMHEMFWLTFITLFGFLIAFVSLRYKTMSFESARLLSLTSGGFITGVPPLYYGMDTIVTVHLAFLALATILMFSRQEREAFLRYLIGILLLFLFVITWNFTIGPIFLVEAAKFKIFNTIVALDTMFISFYFTYFFFYENTEFKDLLALEREKSDNLLLSIFPLIYCFSIER